MPVPSSLSLRSRPVLFVTVAATLFAVPPAHAQSTPSDLTQLSLAELLAVDLGRPERTWQFDYRYSDVHFEGYRNGSEPLSVEDVLFRPGEARTTTNFPVVPTKMGQRVHLVDVSHDVAPGWRISARVPWVQQRSTHVSIVPGFDTFSLETSGFGDISLLVTRMSKAPADRTSSVAAGVTLPTGSIEKRGQTPRGPGLTIVPYSMQIGSGTTDLLAGLSHGGSNAHLGRLGQASWVVSTQARLRMGSNGRGYRLGHQLTNELQVGVRPWARVWPLAGLTWSMTGRIVGEDPSMTIPGPFPYPAPVTNPSLYGGTVVNARVGVEIPLSTQAGRSSARTSLTIQAARRAYAWLHGPQPPESWRFIAAWRLSL